MKAIGLFSLLICVAGCQKPPAGPPVPVESPKSISRTRVITGQVFVARKDGVNVKLGAAEVQAVGFADAQRHMTASEVEFRERIKPLKAEVERRKQMEDVLQAEREKTWKSVTNANANLNKLLDKTRASASKTVDSGNTAKTVEATLAFVAERERFHAIQAEFERKHVESKKAALDAEVQRLEAEIQLSNFTVGQVAFSRRWTNSVATATTDADGRFKLEIPSGVEVVLVCKCQRLVLTNKEEYHWVVTVATNASEVILSNANLLR